MNREGKITPKPETKFCDIRDLPSRTSEYGRSEDRWRAGVDKTTSAFSFSSRKAGTEGRRNEPEYVCCKSNRKHSLILNPPRTSRLCRVVGEGTCAKAAESPGLLAVAIFLQSFLSPESKGGFRGFFSFSQPAPEQPKTRQAGLSVICEGEIMKSVRGEQLQLEYHKVLCAKCGIREIYQYSRTMDWCEECLWDLIKEDQEC